MKNNNHPDALFRYLFTGLLLLLFGSQSNFTHAQDDFGFQIVDSQTHENLDSVFVVVQHLNRKYQSDRFGRVVLHGELAPGDTILVTRQNYVTRTMAIPQTGDNFIRLDRLSVDLRDVEVVAYTQETRRFEAPQTISTLHAEDFDRNSAADIQPTINTIPGVMMESRGDGGSRRLSIRGSLMRSPFGVRNVKLYWNEFPLTIADGSSALELIDPEEIGQVDVLKGPQGSIYGEGHGGAMLFRTKMAPYGKLRASVNYQLGSYGMEKQTLSFSTSSKKTAVTLNYFRYRHDGYRAQESVRKDQLNLVTRFRPESNREIKLFFIYYDGSWGLPGQLDSLNAAENPRSARPFAIENDTRVDRKWLRVGLSNKIHFTDRFYNFSAVFMHTTTKLNPFGTSEFYNGLKDEGSTGYGLRTLFGYEIDSEEAGIHFMLGGEFQRDLNALVEFDLQNGDAGDVRTSDETLSRNFNVFFKTVTHHKRKLVLDASIGLMTTYFDREDMLADTTQDRSLQRNFEPVWLPQISMRYTLSDKYVVYALVSRGVSTPTLWEIQSSPSIEPERSDHFELGVRGSLVADKVFISLNGYVTRIENAITEHPDSLGFSRFENSGSLELRGLETEIKFRHKGSANQWLSHFNLGFNLGIQAYTFNEFQTVSEDFSGNEIPGIPEVNYSVVSDVTIRGRLSVRANYRFFDAMPLNNENSAYSEPYDLLDLRLGYLLPIGDQFFLDLYVGAENALDVSYSSFFRLNANDGRYFNPQAGRTFYAGLKFTFEKPNQLIR